MNKSGIFLGLCLALNLCVSPLWAAPVVTIKITSPAGTSGADTVTGKIYKGIPWLPCVNADTEFSTVAKNKLLATSSRDQLKFDLSVTNEDLDKNGVMDYDLYVLFINHGALSGNGTGTPSGKAYYFMTETTSFSAPTLTAYADDTVLNALSTAPPKLVSATNFTSTAYTATLFGAPIDIDTPHLNQGMWSVMAILASSTAITDGITIMDPRLWEAWTIQPFIIGSPFSSAYGVGPGTTTGDGTCK